MKQPILKSRLSTLIDFSLTQFDLGLPTESEATGVENLEQPQIDDSKIINEIVAKIFPNGIPGSEKSLSFEEEENVAKAVVKAVHADDSLMRKLLSVSSDQSLFETKSPIVTAALYWLYHSVW